MSKPVERWSSGVGMRRKGEKDGQGETDRDREIGGEKKGEREIGRGAWQETTDGNISEWRRVGKPV